MMKTSGWNAPGSNLRGEICSAQPLMDMARDETDLRTATVQSGIYRIEFYPRKSLAPDPAVAVLKKVGCTVMEPGYCREQRTVVRVLMYGWTGRIAVAKQLVAVRKAGCNVAVIVNNVPAQKSHSAKVAATLIKGKVPTWDDRRVKNRVATTNTSTQADDAGELDGP